MGVFFPKWNVYVTFLSSTSTFQLTSMLRKDVKKWNKNLQKSLTLAESWGYFLDCKENPSDFCEY